MHGKFAIQISTLQNSALLFVLFFWMTGMGASMSALAYLSLLDTPPTDMFLQTRLGVNKGI